VTYLQANPEPLTERILPRAGLARWLAILAWCSVPIVRLAAFALLLAGSGLADDPWNVFDGRIQGVLLNVYILAIVLIGTRPVAERLNAIGRLGGQSTERVASLQASATATLAIALFLTVTTESLQFSEFDASAIASAPLPFVVSFAGTFLMRVPQSAAFWVSVVALLTVAELGRQPVPGTFPEDRSLGLKSVGQLLTTILFLYVVLFTPTFLLGTSTLVGLITILALFALGLTAMLFAVWAMHKRMAAERKAAIDAARAQFAEAYRAARATASEANARRLEITRMLLDGAESIHEWPFDDRTQRIVGLLLSGVVTGVVVRLVIFSLGI
jgi:hypothetical protein